MVHVRDADDRDIPAITSISNALIDSTTYEWSERPHTDAETAQWLQERRAAGYPTLVAVERSAVVGWAGYAEFRDTRRWPGYRTTVEHSVHVREHHWGQGVGRALMSALTDRARAAGAHVMVAAVDASNERSIAFHAALGFDEVARMPETGQKFGRWLDLVLMQRIIDR